MTDHEILLELLEEKRRSDRERKTERFVYCVILAVIVLVLIVIGLKINGAIRQVQTNIDRINEATQEITDFFSGLKEAGYDNVEQALTDLHDATSRINGFFDVIFRSGHHIIQIPECRDILILFWNDSGSFK